MSTTHELTAHRYTLPVMNFLFRSAQEDMGGDSACRAHRKTGAMESEHEWNPGFLKNSSHIRSSTVHANEGER